MTLMIAWYATSCDSVTVIAISLIGIYKDDNCYSKKDIVHQSIQRWIF